MNRKLGEANLILTKSNIVFYRTPIKINTSTRNLTIPNTFKIKILSLQKDFHFEKNPVTPDTMPDG